MWGRVIEHARGFRSEFAYPTRLRLICGPCLVAGHGPGIPTGVKETGPDEPQPVALFPPCAEHLEEAPAGASVYDAHEIESSLLDRFAVDLLPFEHVKRLPEGTLAKLEIRCGHPGCS
jgi:hypothetical protein